MAHGMTSYWIMSFGDYFVFVEEGYLLEHGCLMYPAESTAENDPTTNGCQ